MEIKIRLSEQEQQWITEIAEHYQIPLVDAIKKAIREQHEHMSMDLAYNRFPQGELASTSERTETTRSLRKAALKKALIDKAMNKM